MNSLEKYIERFNEGNLDIRTYFGDYKNFFNLLKKKDLLSYIDPISGSESEIWQNEFMLWLLESDKNKFNYWVGKMLSDVEFDENGNPYLILSDRGRLSSLFCPSRNSIDPKTIEQILSGDYDYFDRHWDTTDDVHRDVIEELNSKNLRILYDHIIYESNNLEISPDTETLEIIAQEQGHPEYVRIDNSNIEKIVDDEETMKFLFREYLSDVQSNLYSLHSQSYNDAYESELFDEIWNELSTFFEGKGESVLRPHPYKKDTDVEYFKIPIVNFYSNLKDFLQENLKYTNTLYYYGDYIAILNETFSCLTVHAPDYPSYRKIDQNINKYFSDYF